MAAVRTYPARPRLKRVVILLPESQIDEVDKWGVPSGMRSRTEAIRSLIDLGLRRPQNPAFSLETKKGSAPA